jgi:hypothetical protein
MLKVLLRVKRGCSLMRSESDLTRSLRNVGLRECPKHIHIQGQEPHTFGGALGLVGYVVNTTERFV